MNVRERARTEDADRCRELLAARVRIDRIGGVPAPRTLDRDLKQSADTTLRMMDDDYCMFGKSDGRGVAIRSDEPVDFHRLHKTLNVVCVPSLGEAGSSATRNPHVAMYSFLSFAQWMAHQDVRVD